MQAKKVTVAAEVLLWGCALQNFRAKVAVQWNEVRLCDLRKRDPHGPGCLIFKALNCYRFNNLHYIDMTLLLRYLFTNGRSPLSFFGGYSDPPYAGSTAVPTLLYELKFEEGKDFRYGTGKKEIPKDRFSS